MSESRLQKSCIEYLKEQGIYCINIHGGGWGARGVPDLIACIGGRFVSFELKVGKNDLEPAQRIHRDRIIKSGGLHFSPRSLNEFIRIVNKVQMEVE
jgi:Holliday junction resolvase